MENVFKNFTRRPFQWRPAGQSTRAPALRSMGLYFRRCAHASVDRPPTAPAHAAVVTLGPAASELLSSTWLKLQSITPPCGMQLICARWDSALAAACMNQSIVFSLVPPDRAPARRPPLFHSVCDS